MDGIALAQLLVQFGPPALKMISELFTIGTKEMTPDEILAFCTRHQKSYDQYRAEGPQPLA